MKTIQLLLVLLVFGLVTQAMAANTIANTAVVKDTALVVDDIRFEVKQFHIDSATSTATAEVQLTSLKGNPRELKINVYGTQLVDNDRNAYYFSTITLGRVLIRFEDRQNYMHFLLQPDTPATLSITAANIASTADFIQVVKIVFEDSTEEGRFLDAYLGEKIP